MDGSVVTNGLTRLFKQSLLHLSLLRQKLFHLFLRNCLSSFKLNFTQNMKYNYLLVNGKKPCCEIINYRHLMRNYISRRFSSLNNFRRFKFSALSYGRNLITLIECTLFQTTSKSKIVFNSLQQHLLLHLRYNFVFCP